MREYIDWIRKHMPKYVQSNMIEYGVRSLEDYYTRGSTVYLRGERGPDTIEYTARSQDDLRIWAFKQAASGAAQMMELQRRSQNRPKWRYVRDHAENGKWLYVEHSSFTYNAIEDSRLDWFEVYLRLTKPVLPPAQWEQEVSEHIRLMNISYPQPHWGYDKADMRIIEISDSKYVSEGIEEPAPGTIIRKE